MSILWQARRLNSWNCETGAMESKPIGGDAHAHHQNCRHGWAARGYRYKLLIYNDLQLDPRKTLVSAQNALTREGACGLMD